MALTDKLSAIGDAIRTKTGKTEPLKLEEMPSEIEGIDTTSEDILAFVNNTIEHFVATPSMTTLRPYLFYEGKLKTADLRNVEKIGVYCFCKCKLLENVVFPTTGNNLIIGSRAFQYCTALTSVMCEASAIIYSGSPYIFDGCTALKELYIPNVKVENTNGFCFDCSNLEKVILRYVRGTNSFKNCSSLSTLIILHDSFEDLIDINAFAGTPIEAGTGYIYVRKALIEEYKVATNWVNFAEQFRAIEDYPEIYAEVEQWL